jgi:hypothetical protein
MDVSIIIVNWNTCRFLEECLQSVYDQTKIIDFEVIVIDNASTDGSAEMVKRVFPNVILIENKENRGFAAANNQGIKAGKGKYFLLLNSDTIILDNAVEKVVKFSDSHDKAAVVACKTLNFDRSLQPNCFMFPSVLNLFLSTFYLCHLFPRNSFFGRERMSWWDWKDSREVDVVTGCFMFVRREAIDLVGMMDDSYFMYFEETDWCYRFKKAGWKILFIPDAEIIHLGGSSSKQVRSEMLQQHIRSMLLFFRKHRSRLSYRLACLLLAICFFLRAPFWLAKAIFSKNERSAHIEKAKSYTVGAFRSLFGVHT